MEKNFITIGGETFNINNVDYFTCRDAQKSQTDSTPVPVLMLYMASGVPVQLAFDDVSERAFVVLELKKLVNPTEINLPKLAKL